MISNLPKVVGGLKNLWKPDFSDVKKKDTFSILGRSRT